MKKKYRLLFYIPALDGHLIDDIISIVTKPWNWLSPRASHVEVWLPDANEQFSIRWMDGHYEIWGTCLTSTMRGEDNGTVMRPASKVLKNPDRWFYYKFECEERDFGMAMDWADMACANNKGYGKRTLLKFIGINWADKLRNICSQVAHKWCVLCENMEQPPKTPSPRRLAKWCEKLGKERKML